MNINYLVKEQDLEYLHIYHKCVNGHNLRRGK